MPTEVIYARVPASLKQAADTYADEHGTTLTAAVADLLDRGLSQVSDERAMAELRASRSRLAEEKAATEAELQTARAQIAALGTFAQQAGRRIGNCPACKQEITGHDLLVTGACRHCGHALAGLIAPSRAESAIDQRELMILVGAVGVLLGIAYLTCDETWGPSRACSSAGEAGFRSGSPGDPVAVRLPGPGR